MQKNWHNNTQRYTKKTNPAVIEFTKKANELLRQNPNLALQEIEKAYEMDPSNPVVLGTKAKISLRLGNIKEAAVAAQKAVDMQKSAQHYGILAQCFVADGKTAQAVVAAQKAVDLQKNAQGYGILAQCLVADGKTAQAVVAAQKAVDMQKSTQDYGILAETYRKGKQYIQSLEIINQSTLDGYSQNNPSIELTRAYCLMHLSRFLEALQAFVTAEKLFNVFGSTHKHYDSKIKLYCGIIFLKSSICDNDSLKDNGELKELTSRSIAFLQNVDQSKIGSYQKDDLANALSLIKKNS